MASVVPQVTNALLSAPVPKIIEQLGKAIAEAQFALDTNSVEISKTMSETSVEIGGETYNLISLGFVPSFYAFTEATVDAKMSFTMTETKSLGIKAGLKVSYLSLVAASLDVSYSRKFSVSSEGASSIAARLVSLPPPDQLTKILKRLYEQEIIE